MLLNALTLTLALIPLVSAHGKVLSVTGDAGGNGTALGIQGGVVPASGSNSEIQVDTTIFPSTTLLTDGLGKTTGRGKNTIYMLLDVLTLSGARLPQISTTNGTLSGTFRIVTADGAGPIQAVLDPTATGLFSAAIPLTVVEQIPGVDGNFIFPNNDNNKQQRGLWGRAAAGLTRRGAKVVNQEFGFKFEVPAGTTCNGTIGGMTGVCLVKIANSHKAGPFGGVVPVQLAAAGGGGGEGEGGDGAGAKCGRAFQA